VPGLSADDFREAFTRPFAVFYGRLLGRPVTDEEFVFIRTHYEREYYAKALSVQLQAGAHEALRDVGGRATQSILSMAPHEHLKSIVDHHGISDHFVRVEGSHSGSSDGNKSDSLCRHLDSIGADPARTVLIGDTVDDQQAAVACGAEAILVTTGSQSRDALASTGAPVVDTLLEAAEIALRG
jgi:phosphoglycolate phosphatase-like HAD superfamily hydrolase